MDRQSTARQRKKLRALRSKKYRETGADLLLATLFPEVDPELNKLLGDIRELEFQGVTA